MNLGLKLASAKEQITSTIIGTMDNLSLLTCNAYSYDINTIRYSDEILCHRKSYFIWLTCSSRKHAIFNLQESWKDPGRLNTICSDLQFGFDRSEWKYEYTCFRCEDIDILTIMACMSISFKKSIFTDLAGAITSEDMAVLAVSNANSSQAKVFMENICMCWCHDLFVMRHTRFWWKFI